MPKDIAFLISLNIDNNSSFMAHNVRYCIRISKLQIYPQLNLQIRYFAAFALPDLLVVICDVVPPVGFLEDI